MFLSAKSRDFQIQKYRYTVPKSRTRLAEKREEKHMQLQSVTRCVSRVCNYCFWSVVYIIIGLSINVMENFVIVIRLTIWKSAMTILLERSGAKHSFHQRTNYLHRRIRVRRHNDIAVLSKIIHWKTWNIENVQNMGGKIK